MEFKHGAPAGQRATAVISELVQHPWRWPDDLFSKWILKRVQCRLLPSPPPLGSEADRLRKAATLFGIIGRDHRIVGRKSPLLTVLIRSHVVVSHQMALQHLELLPVFKADDVVRPDRRTDRHLGLRLRL